MIYFDSAASYPLLPEALDELQRCFKEHPANPSSAHLAGEAAAKKIEDARELIADAIGALPSEIVFTSGATESNNLALKSHFYEPASKDKRHLVISSIEHKCVHAVADYLQRTANVNVSLIHPNTKGIVTPEALERVLENDTSLVSVMHLNNELGTANPIEEIGALCFERGIKLHTDAAQSFLKLPIDVDDMNLDYLSLSAHKIGGPKGIGAVYIRDRRARDIEPVIHGAGQEEGLRGGTLATPLITSFGAAVKHFPAAYRKLQALQLKSHLLNRLESLGVPFQINGESIDSLFSITLPNTDVSRLLRETGRQFILATGSACSSKEIQASHVLIAIGMQRNMAERTLRISFHHTLVPDNVDRLAESMAFFTRR
ncbi:cysteine desulfurase family protein [Nitrincola alkalilacustris]|uniref:cysteine desulfurase family protein n=1 Tax=Nitrincola alkalilacustris TaxID=1571224 RepID=UPI00124D58EF|nr:cysteine desulfurase family protein [Nitrincola alkalilacustris]